MILFSRSKPNYFQFQCTEYSSPNVPSSQQHKHFPPRIEDRDPWLRQSSLTVIIGEDEKWTLYDILVFQDLQDNVQAFVVNRHDKGVYFPKVLILSK